MYNVDSLNNGIEAGKKNIKIFEAAIEKERDTINQYYDMIDTLKKAKEIAGNGDSS
jgi:hypothetical protein